MALTPGTTYTTAQLSAGIDAALAAGLLQKSGADYYKFLLTQPAAVSAVQALFAPGSILESINLSAVPTTSTTTAPAPVPSAATPVPAPTIAPAPVPTTVPAAGVPDRELALAIQEEDSDRQGEVFRRFLVERGIGRLAPDTQAFLRSGQNQANQYARYNLATGGANPLARQQSYIDWLRSGQQPSAAQLSEQLARATANQERDLTDVGSIQERSQQEFYRDPANAYNAAIQPGLQNVAPSLRDLYRSLAARIQQDFVSSQPENQGGFLQFARRRGFFA